MLVDYGVDKRNIYKEKTSGVKVKVIFINIEKDYKDYLYSLFLYLF